MLGRRSFTLLLIGFVVSDEFLFVYVSGGPFGKRNDGHAKNDGGATAKKTKAQAADEEIEEWFSGWYGGTSDLKAGPPISESKLKSEVDAATAQRIATADKEIDHMFSLWSKGSRSSTGGNNNIPSLSRKQTGLGKDDVIFELYTLKNKDTPQILSIDNITSIIKSNFNKYVPTRFLIHGFLEYNGKLKRAINDAYLSKAKFDANLIAVNWEKLSQTFNYFAARSQVNSIGIHVAAMIDYMVKNHLASINNISLIGFSLGAHIAGMAGKNVKSGKLPKIIGLDPAAPLFSLDKPTERLNREDAKFVEVIHTNGAFLGIENPIGTVDFYPNTGLKQPGCSNDLLGRCSHWRAVEYFVESIYSPLQFYAYPCSSFDDMKKRNCKGHELKMGGKPGNKNAEASIYYLTTNSKSIFARGGSNQHSFTGIHG